MPLSWYIFNQLINIHEVCYIFMLIKQLHSGPDGKFRIHDHDYIWLQQRMMGNTKRGTAIIMNGLNESVYQLDSPHQHTKLKS